MRKKNIVFGSSERVLSMERKRRNCIKKDEDLSRTGIKMEVYTNYSRDACLMECRARLLFKECNCLPYYFPDFSRCASLDPYLLFTSKICICLGLGSKISPVTGLN